jgi:hypothetical protein
MGVIASQLIVKIFADRTDKESMLKAAGYPLIKGFTTNATPMRLRQKSDYQRQGGKRVPLLRRLAPIPLRRCRHGFTL